MPSTLEDRKRIYLSCRSILSNHSPKKRHSPKVRDSLLSNHASLGPLISELGEAKVVDLATKMTRAKIFKSETVARAQFPDLFPAPPGPAPHAEMAGSAGDVTTLTTQVSAAENLADDLAEVLAEDDLAEETLAEDTAAEVTHSEDEEVEELTTNTALVEHSERPPALGGSEKGASELPSVLASKPYDSVAVAAENITQLYGIPSLHPTYLPYSTQHRILTTAQTILEQCCFDFATRWLPEVLEKKGWKCACAVELTRWESVVSTRRGQLPAEALQIPPGASVRRIFHATRELRNTAVHRAPITARSVSQFLEAAVKLAETLRDTHRASQLGELKGAVDDKLEAMEVMKKATEDCVTAQVVSIRRQKEELDRQEKALIEGMLKDDREHKELAGHLLDVSVTEIFGKKSQTATKDGTEGSDVQQWLNLVWFFYVAVTVYWARGKSLIAGSTA
ncbi:hypothetical protein CPLU01_05846 [Colletotrichum plurivorum]|uniref:Ubiquinol-cytochrome-c reductase cytochrome c1 n=1 Tax=Colletotrichum plurivorum TaxID=2175906 RepID=A0A8H6KJY2_9PEZI|nr:hypothetical protein CPLU01_05846 [Colletotrichum plurivorum]